MKIITTIEDDFKHKSSHGWISIFESVAEVVATKTIRVPLKIQNPRVATLAGNSWPDILGLTNIDDFIWTFDNDVESRVYAKVTAPSNLNATPNAKIVYVLKANSTAGQVTRFTISSAWVADAASGNPTLTAETAVDTTMPTTAYLHKEVSVTLTPTVAAKDIGYIEITHNGDHANDTLAVDTLLIEAYLECDADF